MGQLYNQKPTESSPPRKVLLFKISFNLSLLCFPITLHFLRLPQLCYLLLSSCVLYILPVGAKHHSLTTESPFCICAQVFNLQACCGECLCLFLFTLCVCDCVCVPALVCQSRGSTWPAHLSGNQRLGRLLHHPDLGYCPTRSSLESSTSPRAFAF